MALTKEEGGWTKEQKIEWFSDMIEPLCPVFEENAE